jgi:uncharacterized protein (TIGR03067 family)
VAAAASSNGPRLPLQEAASTGSLISTTVVLISAPVLRGGDAKADLDKFQGTWDVTGYERNGEKFPVKAITFTGDNMKRYAVAGDPSPSRPEWAIKLDPSKKPRAIDAMVLTGPQKGKTRVGIYQLEGDELKLCFARPDVKERPGEFKSTEGSELEVITLKRSKK